MGELRVGTSGYVYRHWKGLFYPEDLPASRWLQHYAATFDTVELNATFYRLPTLQAVNRWRNEVPADFVFACKGSRYLTHLKRLTSPAQGLRRYFARALRLKPKLGPVLWQLPPQMNRLDMPRLEHFLRRLPEGVRHAIEFRSPAWYTEEVCQLLDAHRAAFCEHDLVDRPPPRHTGGFRYLRFHGKTGKYQGRYGRESLAPVARDLLAFCRGRGRDAYVYFNNDIGGHAIQDALDLLALSKRAPTTARAAPALESPG